MAAIALLYCMAAAPEPLVTSRLITVADSVPERIPNRPADEISYPVIAAVTGPLLIFAPPDFFGT